jgi:hypothetical protein
MGFESKRESLDNRTPENHSNLMQRERQRPGTRVILSIGTAALAITVLTSYSTNLTNENAKLADQLIAAEDDQSMAAEKMTVTKYPELSDGEGKNIMIRINNDGSSISTYRYVLLYCVSDGCQTNSGVPIMNPSSVSPAPPVSMAPGDAKEIQVGPVADGLTYRIELITERGNIIRTSECTTNFAMKTCENPVEVVENQ